MSKGKEDEWVVIGLDAKISRRQGMPAQLPIPKSEFEGLADKGLSIDNARKWIKAFLSDSPMGKDSNWRKKNSQLVATLEVFLDKAPLLARAQQGFEEQDFEKAASALKRIASMDPDDHSARLNLGAALVNLRDYAGAFKAFTQIRKTYEGDADYHVGMGQLYSAMGNKDEATNEFVLALEAKPDCQGALDALVTLGVLVAVYENPRDAASLTYVRADSVDQYLASVWDAELRDVAFYLEQLTYHEREKRPRVVVAAADRITKASPDAAAAERAELARLGALRDLGQVTDALAAAKAYAERAPKSAGAQVEVGRSLLAAGQVDEARAAFDAALALDPGDLMALQLRYWPANSLTDIQAVSAAIPALEAFATAHPEAAGAWRSLARAKWASGSKDEAVELFRKAVDITPGDDELRAELWSQLGNMQQYQQIVEDSSKVENMNKRDWKLRWNEAEAYLGLGRKLEARGAFAGINFDESLHVDIRKRAKRAVKSIDEGMTLSGPTAPSEGTPAA